MTLDLKEKTNMVLEHALKFKIRIGYSPIQLCVGEQRSGKTLYSIWLAEQLEPDFDVNKQLVTSIEDFAKAFSKRSKSVIILDECGLSLDPMRSAELTQRVYSHIIQSQAVRQVIVMLVLPTASDFGYQHKAHIFSESEVLGHNKRGAIVRNYVLTKWRADPNDVNIRIHHIETKYGIPLPSEENLRKYLDRKQMIDKDSILNAEMMKLEMAKEKEAYRRRIYQLRQYKKEIAKIPQIQYL